MDIVIEVPTPPTLPKSQQEWRTQYQETKRRSREEKRAGHRRFANYGCETICAHFTEGNSRVSKCIETEKRYLELVEMGSTTKDVQSVPRPSVDADFEAVTVAVDSGAHHSVGPPDVATYIEVEDTEASRAGRHYSAANGSGIRNYGQRIISGKNEARRLVNLLIRVADVKKVFGSVREMVTAGTGVVFDRDEHGNSLSYLEHKATGRKTVIYDRSGNYQFDIAVPRGRSEARDAGSKGLTPRGILMAGLFYWIPPVS